MRRSRRSRAEWRDEVARWVQSRLSARAYAAQHDLSPSTLFWWSRELRLVPETPAPQNRVSFVPVRVVKAASPVSAVFDVEVTLTNGRKVRVRGDVDTQRLACVLDAVEGGTR